MMDTKTKTPLGVKSIIGFFILCLILFFVGQGGAVVAYDTVAAWGLQELRESVDPVIVEVNRGIGLGDVVVAIPLFVLAVVGLSRMRFYGAVVSWMVLGINLYWTTVAWAKQFYYLQASVKCQPFDPSVHGVLAFVFIVSAWASWYLFKHRKLFD